MIIKYIENKSGFLFFSKDRISIITDEGEGSVPGEIDEKIVRELNEKLKNFEVDSKEDFLKLKEICGESYKTVEECLINSCSKFWMKLNKDANIIPRPMALILRKDSGIREFYILSLDCGDFQQACFVNGNIFQTVIGKLSNMGFNVDEKGFYHDIDDKKVFEILQDAIKEASKGVTFNIRIAVNFKNGKGDNLKDTKEKIVEYLTNLAFNDNILIAMNPIEFSDKVSYEKLREKVVGDCYLAVENYSGFTKDNCDFVLIKNQDLNETIINSKNALEKNLNIIFDGNPDICVGLKFPIIKIDLRNRDSDKKTERVNKIIEEIREYREGLKIVKD